MSDNAQLAHTGTAGAIVIAGVSFTGWYVLAIALGIVVAGAICIKLAFRPGRGAGQR